VSTGKPAPTSDTTRIRGRRGLARTFLGFNRPAWLPSSPAPASRRLPIMANYRRRG